MKPDNLKAPGLVGTGGSKGRAQKLIWQTVALAALWYGCGALAQERVITPDLCSNCHGYEGHSHFSEFPQLAGQLAPYIEEQLTLFRAKEARKEHFAQIIMWGMAGSLTDEKIKSLAAYYAAQKPLPSTAPISKHANRPAGEKIFAEGNPTQGLLPCMACHGDKAQGVAPATPRLAGQHQDYLALQLRAFRSGRRANTTMGDIAKNLTDEQIRDVSGYLASLR